MPRPPKHPSARRRRNKVAGARTLIPVGSDVIQFPSEPPLPDDRMRWHPYTLRRWQAVMNSPMQSEYTASDIEGLYSLAVLWDDLHLTDAPSMRMRLLAEIRQQEQRFGLSPIDRRRLQWEIARGEEAEARREVRVRTIESLPDGGEDDDSDPRDLLAVI